MPRAQRAENKSGLALKARGAGSTGTHALLCGCLSSDGARCRRAPGAGHRERGDADTRAQVGRHICGKNKYNVLALPNNFFCTLRSAEH